MTDLLDIGIPGPNELARRKRRRTALVVCTVAVILALAVALYLFALFPIAHLESRNWQWLTLRLAPTLLVVTFLGIVAWQVRLAMSGDEYELRLSTKAASIAFIAMLSSTLIAILVQTWFRQLRSGWWGYMPFWQFAVVFLIGIVSYVIARKVLRRA